MPVIRCQMSEKSQVMRSLSFLRRRRRKGDHSLINFGLKKSKKRENTIKPDNFNRNGGWYIWSNLQGYHPPPRSSLFLFLNIGTNLINHKRNYLQGRSPFLFALQKRRIGYRFTYTFFWHQAYENTRKSVFIPPSRFLQDFSVCRYRNRRILPCSN